MDRFLYVRVLKQRWFDDEILAPKRRPKLPTVLSAAQEITPILDGTRNLKHWTILATLYATGIRASELRRLKPEDIDKERMMLHIRHGKGQVARDLSLSPVLLDRLRIYRRWRKPKEWLFPRDRTTAV